MAPWKNTMKAEAFTPPEAGAAQKHSVLEDMVEPAAAPPLPLPAPGLDSPSTKARLNTIKTMMHVMIALTRRPGSLASAEEKREAMGNLLREIMREADSFAPLVSSSHGQQSWVTGQATQFIAELVAASWVEHGSFDVSEQVGVLRTLMGSDSFGAFASRLADADYRIAEGPDDAKARLALSASKVAGRLFDEIRRFSFFLPPGEVLSSLMAKIMDAVDADRGLDVSADMRLARVQSHLNRLGDLVAAEYLAQAKDTLDRLIVISDTNGKDAFKAAKKEVLDGAQRSLGELFDRAVKGFAILNLSVDKVVERHFQGHAVPPAP